MVFVGGSGRLVWVLPRILPREEAPGKEVSIGWGAGRGASGDAIFGVRRVLGHFYGGRRTDQSLLRQPDGLWLERNPQ